MMRCTNHERSLLGLPTSLRPASFSLEHRPGLIFLGAPMFAVIAIPGVITLASLFWMLFQLRRERLAAQLLTASVLPVAALAQAATAQQLPAAIVTNESLDECPRCGIAVPVWFLDHVSHGSTFGGIAEVDACRHCTDGFTYPTANESETAYVERRRKDRA
jgi:hypothetical protein